MDTCICVAESLRYSHETVTTLITGYTPIQNKKFKKKKENTMNKNQNQALLFTFSYRYICPVL